MAIAGVVAFVVLAGTAIAIFRLVTGSIATNPAMEQAVGLAQADVRVIARLGPPLAAPARPRGHLQCSLLSKRCSLDAMTELSGALRAGTLHAKGTSDARGWNLTTAVVLIDGSPPIDLLRSEAGDRDKGALKP